MNKRWVLKTKKPAIFLQAFKIIVPRTRLELAHRNRHQPLKLACLPISPSGQNDFAVAKI